CRRQFPNQHDHRQVLYERLCPELMDGGIIIKGVSKAFEMGGTIVEALKDVNLEVRRQEFVAFVGPSGCGKSTLLRIVSGLTRPSKGEVEIDGVRIVRPFVDVGIVFQTPALLPWRKVLGNVLLQLQIRGETSSEHRTAARHLLRTVGLDAFRD